MCWKGKTQKQSLQLEKNTLRAEHWKQAGWKEVLKIITVLCTPLFQSLRSTLHSTDLWPPSQRLMRIMTQFFSIPSCVCWSLLSTCWIKNLLQTKGHLKLWHLSFVVSWRWPSNCTVFEGEGVECSIRSIKRVSKKIKWWHELPSIQHKRGILALLCRQPSCAESLPIWLQPRLFPEHSFCLGSHLHPCLSRMWEYMLFPVSALCSHYLYGFL